MESPATQSLQWADDETLSLVRPEVRKILQNSTAFRALPPEEQRSLAGTMVKVATYMVDPDRLASQELSQKPKERERKARALAEDPVEATKRRLSQSPGSTGKDFQAGAVRQGVEQFGALVQKVDFPKFVSGLIQNVFQAIVDSSIQQMKAYGELLANVAKTVDQFAQDNISSNNARDWLAQKYSDSLDIGTSDSDTGFAAGDTPPAPQPKVVTTGDNPEQALQSISADLQLDKPVTDISDPAEEERLVLGAKLQMARSRQQLLASMVLLGINRIVVTDGLIHAKVVFDMRASDTQARQARASMYDSQATHAATQMEASYGGWFSPVSGDISAQASTDHVTTVQSSVDDTSESKAEIKANLTGEVKVNFKSDYMPMEKMATPQMIASITGNATPYDPNAPKQAAGAKA